LSELTALYEAQLQNVNSLDEFKLARLNIDRDALLPREVRDRLGHLRDQVLIRDREVDIDYDIEERDGERMGVARLRLPEKIARTLTEAEIPQLDRPVRFVVLRGQRGAVRADTLDDLQERLAQPWSPDELQEGSDDRAMLSVSEREVREIANKFRRHRDEGRRNRHGVRKPHHGSGGRPSSRRRRGRQ
jgi:hypothetical protein